MQKYALAIAALTLLLGCDGDKPTTTATSAAVSAKPSAAGSTVVASSPVPEKGKVFFISPLDGAKVLPDVDISFGIEGPALAAGGRGDSKNKGYFWVIAGDGIAQGQSIVKSDKRFAFARGEKFGTIKLAPGKHKITLQLSDRGGRSYGPKFAKSINVEVVADDGERSVEIVEPKDGSTVKSKFKIKFGVKGMKIQKAGEAPIDRIAGHHHVIIDGKWMDFGQEVPANKTNIHYGKGQTEAELELEKGEHTLTAQFADGSHRSYGKKMSQTIKITVE
jgi:hypothetical protein